MDDGSDGATEVGYDPDVDPDADPHGPEVGADAVELTYRHLLGELTGADSVADLVRTVERYGWLPPVAALAVHGLVRGVFEHFTEPVAASKGYVFPGWELALGINVVYGLATVAFAWFMYFGLVGSLAGFLSAEATLDTAVFKVGAYFSLVFVPVLLVSIPILYTIPPPETAIGGTDPTREVVRSVRSVHDTPQMRLVGALKALGWGAVGFLMLPVVEELYDVSKRRSVLVVLPVTLAAVVATQLV